MEILIWIRLYLSLLPASFIYLYVKEPGMTWNSCAMPQHLDFLRWGGYWSLPSKLFRLWWSKNVGWTDSGVSLLWGWLWWLFYYQWCYRLFLNDKTFQQQKLCFMLFFADSSTSTLWSLSFALLLVPPLTHTM